MTVKTYDDLTPHAARVVSAFKLAYRQMGIPDHPDGKCPGADCSCRELAWTVEARVADLLDDPLIGDAEACEYCHVLVPFLDDCYMIGCGNVVCLLCGEVAGRDPGQRRSRLSRKAGRPL